MAIVLLAHPPHRRTFPETWRRQLAYAFPGSAKKVVKRGRQDTAALDALNLS